MVDGIPLSQVTALVEASVAVATQPDLRAVLETTVRVARDATGAAHAAVGVIAGDGSLGEFVHVGLTDEVVERIGTLPVGKGVLGVLVRDPAPLRLDRIADHPAAAGFPDGHPEMTTFLGVPIRVGDTVFGNLYLTDKPGGFAEHDEVVVVALATIVGGAVASARLHQRLARLVLMEDRERIARDLHDAVIQDLIAVGFTVQAVAAGLGDAGTGEALGQAVDRIERAIDDLRSSIFGLRSLHLAASDPVLALRRLTADLAGSAAVDLHLDEAALRRLAPDLVDDLLLIVREAISNATRHGDARTVEVRVVSEEGFLSLTVTDDGIGFDTAVPVGGLGLGNMSARAARAGGDLRLSSSPGVGTVVAARLPTWGSGST